MSFVIGVPFAAGEIDRPDVDVAALRIVSHDDGTGSVGREIGLVVEARLTDPC